uniref:Glyceraldehyde-3-phosphate dehydrogenase/erythrose-4-phosphate dehydrogenase n=1 Tax=Siphoviridae sp. ctLmu1 TaxID=2826253 RepID=A0A8S5NHL5_9CAUD|nr:MAG TPA: Glyceraldehyde-3-phosphate dehydrogenase/erythrose-4-phosphate dehydrogenase [Siphoviridae sp. ctLmu1]
MSWYDNENSYTSQMVRTIKYFACVLIIRFFQLFSF